MNNELIIECATCYYGGNCKHPLKKKTGKAMFCLELPNEKYGIPHPKYPNLKKVRNYYAYTYWEPKNKKFCDGMFLTDEDFEI